MENKLIFVTGLSGAGMSSALKAMEDIDFEVLDNFPLSLVEALLEDKKSAKRRIAIGIDSRTRNFSASNLITAAKKFEAKLVFVTCDDVVLQKRFTETRRKHPLAKDRAVSDGVAKERILFEPVLKKSDMVIDTSEHSIHDLRRIINAQFASDQKDNLSVSLMSFGFRNGLPREADIVMDVRFLKNPHWDAKLKKLTGQNDKVGKYIETDNSFEPFITNFKALVGGLLERYSHEGKSYLTIAIGCTGGKHRSVYTVEKLKPWLEELGLNTNVIHRDMPV